MRFILKTKTLAQVLTAVVVVIALVAPAMYTIAHNTANESYNAIAGTSEDLDIEWWNEMREHMKDHWDEPEGDSYYRYGGCH